MQRSHFEFSSLLMATGILLAAQTDAYGYSYARFIGPVRGPERKIFVHDALRGGPPRIDYIAEPEYQFAYGVEDAKTRVLQNHRETRSGDAVKGVYSVVDPDGTLRVVKYKADNVNGFQAEVISNGVSTFHGQPDPITVGYRDSNNIVPDVAVGSSGKDNYQHHMQQHMVHHNVPPQQPQQLHNEKPDGDENDPSSSERQADQEYDDDDDAAENDDDEDSDKEEKDNLRDESDYHNDSEEEYAMEEEEEKEDS